MTDSHYPPSVVAFLAEQDMIRAHRDRLGEDLQRAKEVWEKQHQELEQERFKTERLQIEVDRLTARNDSQSRIVHRLVAKVETMALVMATQVNEIKDEIERAQFAPPKPEPMTEEEQFYEGEQWKPDEIEALTRQRPTMPVKINRIEEPEVEFVSPQHEPLDPDEDDVDVERIGREFGAGFPDKMPRDTDQRRYDPQKDRWADANQDQVRKGALFPAVPRTVPSDLQPPRGPSKDRLPPSPSFRG